MVRLQIYDKNGGNMVELERFQKEGLPMTVKSEYKADLKKKMLFFSNVDTLESTSIRWSSIRF